MNKQVVLYTSPTCPSCAMIEEYLSSHGVKYEKIDITKDRQALEELVRRTGKMITPDVQIGDEIVVGFDKLAIDQLLGLGRNNR